MDDAVMDAGRRAVGKGEIVETRRQADVVDDMTAVFLRNDLADPVFDRLEDPFSFLDSSGRRRADMKLDLASVDCGEEIAADKQKHRNAKRQYERRNARRDEAS